MLPTSAKAPDRFTPDGSDVTYLIEIPTSVTKAKYRRAVTASGVRFWPKFALIESARAAIDEASPANAAVLIGICDRFEQLASPASEETVKAVNKDWAELSRILQGTGGDFAEKVADNEFWFEMAPRIAARCFLVGTETQKLKRNPNGMLADETIDNVIAEDVIRIIGWRALGMFEPSEAEAKNSASPLPSPSGPASSTAASAPSTEATGKSSENDTKETQN